MIIDIHTIIFSFVFGSFIGSFFNVVIWRFPRNESLIHRRSYCPKCKTQIHWYQNIPLLSWILQKGRCGFCRKEISIRYPLIECLCAVLYVLCNFAFPNSLRNNSEEFILLAGWIFVSILLTLSIIDFDHLWLPESICRLGFFSGLITILINSLSLKLNDIWPYLFNHAGAICIGYLGFQALRAFTRIIYRKDVVGRGDANLASMLGVWLGINGLGIAISLAYIFSGIFVLIGFLLNRLNRGEFIAFGPFLSIGGLLVWLFGNEFWVHLIYM